VIDRPLHRTGECSFDALQAAHFVFNGLAIILGGLRTFFQWQRYRRFECEDGFLFLALLSYTGYSAMGWFLKDLIYFQTYVGSGFGLSALSGKAYLFAFRFRSAWSPSSPPSKLFC
jgi:hypothetical protein